jgi:hypothetical protein
MWRVAAVYFVAHVGEHVVRGDDAHERWEFGELLQLFAPLLLVAQVNVRAKFYGLKGLKLGYKWTYINFSQTYDML